MRDVRLIDRPFDPGREMDAFVRSHSEAGGVATFVGKVRPTGDVECLELSHYAPLTLPGMERLADEALGRWDLMGLLVLHRTGIVSACHPIVVVSAASRHRRAAIESVDFVMDHLKSDAWFWKREKRPDGWHWIEPREEDHRDLARWSEKSPLLK